MDLSIEVSFSFPLLRSFRIQPNPFAVHVFQTLFSVACAQTTDTTTTELPEISDVSHDTNTLKRSRPFTTPPVVQTTFIMDSTTHPTIPDITPGLDGEAMILYDFQHVRSQLHNHHHHPHRQQHRLLQQNATSSRNNSINVKNNNNTKYNKRNNPRTKLQLQQQ